IPHLARPLGLPLEGRRPLPVTPHGHFGAHRKGPPEHWHQGLDLEAPRGSHVLAVADGQIVSTDPGLGQIVRKLRLNTPAAWTDGGVPVHAVVYADLGKPLVEPGARVHMGDAIAVVASRGFVHFATKTLQGGKEIFFDPKLAGLEYRGAAVDREVS